MQSIHPLVLLVDDEPVVGDLLRTLLEQADYRIETAADGLTGQARVQEGGINLLVLGRQLPVGDGLKLCAWVRAHEGPAYLPIIVLTLVADQQERHAGFVTGVDDYFTQPFEYQEVLDRVAAHLRAQRHSQLMCEQQRGLLAQRKGALLEAAGTIHELLRLLRGMLDGIESLEARNYSREDIARLRAQLHAAVSQITARMHTSTGKVCPPQAYSPN